MTGTRGALLLPVETVLEPRLIKRETVLFFWCIRRPVHTRDRNSIFSEPAGNSKFGFIACMHIPISQMENYIHEDFLNLTIGNLKDLLDLRGLYTTGRKVGLAARAFSAFELKMPITVSQEHQLPGLR